MSFTSLQIRFQTARSLPAPYAYFYTLAAKPANTAVQIDFSITYPDRDDIDDDELLAEGFTRDDDFSWSGQLPNAWLQTLTELISKTQLRAVDEDALDEDDEFWDVMLEQNGQQRQTGRPTDTDGWQYSLQELIQAIYEKMGRERPFELTFLSQNGPNDSFERRVTASFADRSVLIRTMQNQRDEKSYRPWSALKRLMSEIYAHDYDPDESQPKRPRQPGQWLNLGTDEWYEISDKKKIAELLMRL
ncbi:hypothetical protein [Spirosoma montaniterrae]|uniref:Uncharacterized protein n=1 Tax=Spirosoma montaniterrae TaxID=1178516 RepID=A0A1P9WUS0_9BACT|nr:hypothetical protein [Spirosoma montaniterrae]AQG79124.1 hypothetical protein AWR27_07185 [Spirosoma montaniterrae]